MLTEIAIAFVALLLAFIGAGAVAVLLDVPPRWRTAVVLFVLGSGLLAGAVLS